MRSIVSRNRRCMAAAHWKAHLSAPGRRTGSSTINAHRAPSGSPHEFLPLHPCKLLRNIQPQTGASRLPARARIFQTSAEAPARGIPQPSSSTTIRAYSPSLSSRTNTAPPPGCVLKRIGKQVQHDPVQTLRIAQQTARTFGTVFKPQRNAARLSIRSGASTVSASAAARSVYSSV